MKTSKQFFAQAGLLGADGIQPARSRLTQIECVTLIAILLLGAESAFAQSGVHRFGAITSQPDRTIFLGFLGDVPLAHLPQFGKLLC